MNCNLIKVLATLSTCILAPIFHVYAKSTTLFQKEIREINIPKESFQQIGILPGHIQEASGLALSTNKTLWTHNDDGVPVLFCVDLQGNVVNSLHLNNLNSGWEDLAKDNDGNLYIGAFGNNKNDKRDLKILKVPNPETINEKVYNAEVIHFTYQDQFDFPPPPSHRNFDADALLAYKDKLFILTKNRTSPFSGYTKIYRLPNVPGNYVAELVDSIFVGQGPMVDNWVTGADLSPDGQTLVLLGHGCIWLIRDFEDKKFSSGTIIKVNLNNYTHKAGITFASSTEVYIVDEKEFGMLGGKIYMLDLAKIMALDR